MAPNSKPDAEAVRLAATAARARARGEPEPATSPEQLPNELLERYCPAAAFVIPVMLWLTTAPRNILWGDGIELTSVAATLGIAHPTGYPTWTLLAHFATWLPVGSAYFRVTLFCLLCMAVACVLLYRLLHREFSAVAALRAHAPLAALLSTLLFACCDTVWNHAARVEVYAFAWLLGIALVSVVARFAANPSSLRGFLGAFFLWGLALTHHLLAISAAPLLISALVLRVRWLRETAGGMKPGPALVRSFGIAAVALLLGLLPLLYLPLRASQSPNLNWGDPSSVERLRWTLSGGDFAGQRLLQETPGNAFTLTTFASHALRRTLVLATTFGLPAPALRESEPALYFSFVSTLALLVLAGFGLRRIARVHPGGPSLAVGFAALLAAYAFFLYAYNIPDIADYQMGFLGLLWISAGFGVAQVFDQLGDRGRRLVPAALGAATLAVLLCAAANRTQMDRSGVTTPASYAAGLFHALPENAILLTAGDNDIYAAWYAQEVEGLRPDLLVFGTNFVLNDWYNAYFRKRDLRGRSVRAVAAPPTTDIAFIETLGANVIDPNLGKFPLYTTLDIPAFRRRYTLEPVATLLTPDEFRAAIEAGEYPGPPLLFRIVPR